MLTFLKPALLRKFLSMIFSLVILELDLFFPGCCFLFFAFSSLVIVFYLFFHFRAHGNELWVLLVEKAYAKSCGSYENIRFGYCFEALLDLTGAPFRNIKLDDPYLALAARSDKLWLELLEYDRRGCLLCASTPGDSLLFICFHPPLITLFLN